MATPTAPAPAQETNVILPTFKVSIRPSAVNRVATATGASAADAVKNASVLFLQAELAQDEPAGATFTDEPAPPTPQTPAAEAFAKLRAVKSAK